MQDIIKRMSGKRIAVVGDLMLDRYIWGRVQRISPEAPVPVVEVESDSDSPGGAANVASNLIALGCSVLPFGILGEDEPGRKLLGLLQDQGMPADGILMLENRPTTVKSRVIAHQQHVVRVDREETGAISDEAVGSLLAQLATRIDNLDAILIEDYNKGLLTPALIEGITTLASEHHVPVTVDPKFHHFRQYKGVTLFKPNRREAEEVLAIRISNTEEAGAAAAQLKQLLQCKAVLITLGAEGMLLLDDANRRFHIPTQARQVHDVSGAGDTVISTLTAAIAAGASFDEAARLANHAAGVVVGEIGAVPITPAKLNAALTKAASP